MPECKEALDMAIKALECEPCDDDINVVRTTTVAERKTGYWYVDERPESDREVVCSNCDQPIFKYHKLDFDYRPKYCPNCGAKIVELQEESEDV